MARFSHDLRPAILAGIIGLLSVGPAQAADTVADFYKGKTITIVVGTEPGNPYDVNARLIQRYLPKHLPGSPSVIVTNMVGAGSMNAANYVYSVAAQDGTFINAASAPIPFLPLFDVKAAKFEARKAYWLPVPTSETFTLSVWGTVPLKTFLDARNRETVFGTTGPTSAPAYFLRLFNDIFQTKFKMIHGYGGSAAQFQAMERGEVEGHGSATWTTVKTTYPQWLKDGRLRILLQYGGNGPNPELAGVPYARDLLTSDESKQLLDISTGQTLVARPYMMGPGVPKERVEAMRKAFMDVFHDPEMLAEAKKINYTIAPLSGEEVQKIIDDAYAAPQGVIDHLRRVYAAEN
jgi:tripartite-type tricarboxylate transporter receptor subunit TctC